MLEVGILENIDAIFGLYVSFPISTVVGRSGPVLAGNGFFEAVIVAKFKGGGAFNVIPDSVTIGGTFKAFSKESLMPLKQRIQEVITGQVAMHRCNATVNFDDKTLYHSTVNNKELHRYFGTVARDMLGEKNVLEMQPLMGAEDFSFFAKAVPGYF
ncbi:IAA-amino acid hydrolase ILR1-like 4 [Camellia lanceoleosa]|uniref:IAA-amino acid hydrolase ILR1-like 4 n=1 Tax=Camellia lanceoleosa TaxID=1840588 RepID=A0ACC0G4J8_9ERIC|nr:IAA-amino acid hydrolase ILR1-like 4 [Camellia lanceoleosa]